MEQTFVLATHNPALASIADRVLQLEHGRLREVEATDDLAVTGTSGTEESGDSEI
jgi:ABC-type lipoprotein export system ATPase subunit